MFVTQPLHRLALRCFTAFSMTYEKKREDKRLRANAFGGECHLTLYHYPSTFGVVQTSDPTTVQPDLVLHAPAEARGVYGRIPQLNALFVHAHQCDGDARHFEAGDVRADQVAHHAQAVLLRDFSGLAIR